MTSRSVLVRSATILLLAAALGGCSDDECVVDESYNPPINPSDFATPMANPLYPLTPGAHWIYGGGDEVIDVTVTSDTKVILGVTCVVVRDTVTKGGTLFEDTYDWYSADNQGNVWYFGEYTEEYEDGETSTEGSWEAGVDGAKPGIVMQAAPQVGASYRQEYYACEAEDLADVEAVAEAVTVPYGSFTGCVRTRDYTPLDPEANENKYYCPDVGVALEIDLTTGQRIELQTLTLP